MSALGMCAHNQVSYWKNSTTVFTHAIEVTQNNHLAHYNLGVAFYKEGQNSLALEHYKKALEILPNYESAAFAIGTLLAEQNDLNKATEYFHKAVLLKPDSARDHNYLAVTLQKMGKLDEAAAHFTRAMELQPDWIEPMNNLAGLIIIHPEIKGHDINEAIHLTHRICELTEYNDPAFLGNLAMAYAAAGKFPEAVETGQRALRVADSVNRPEIKSRIQSHLTSYMEGKPYVEPRLKKQ
jgi:tetratricopeptide (TPR) repeat protein